MCVYMCMLNACTHVFQTQSFTQSILHLHKTLQLQLHLQQVSILVCPSQTSSRGNHQPLVIHHLFSLFLSNTVNPTPPQSTTQSQTPSDQSIVFSITGDKSTLQRRKEAFPVKLQNFKMMMARLGFAQSSRLKYNIRRDHMLEDAYEHVMKSDLKQLQNKRLNITFKGEEG